MAEHLRHDLGMNVLGEADGGEGMPQRMQVDAREPGLADHSIVIVSECSRLQRRANSRRKNEVLVDPFRPGSKARFELSPAVRAQSIDHDWHERNDPARLRRLRLLEYEATSAGALQRAANMKQTRLEIN